MSKAYTLMTPGPVPIPPEVLEILALPMEHHRTPEFVALFNRVRENLRQVFVTEQPAFIQTSTGSGGLESAIVNCLSPGDRIISVVSGKFGERWAEMAETFGVHVTRLEVPWGKAARVSDIAELLKSDPGIKAVLTQACETSTGVLHPIREIAQLTRNLPTVLIVDAITALGAMPMPMDEWGIDVMIGGSQKAFMLPTGLSFISFSKKAWALTENAKCAKFYFDIREEKKANDNGESLFSSAVTHIRALDLVLDIFFRQGMMKVYARIAALSLATQEASRLLGLKTFSEIPSASVTAIAVPDGIDGQLIRADMEKISHVIVMGGQDRLKGKILRIGHMGAISDVDLINTIDAMAQAFNRARPGMMSEAQLIAARARAQEILQAHPAVVMKV